MFFKELTSRNDDTKRPKSMLQTSQPDLKSFKKLKSNKHHYNPTIEIEKVRRNIKFFIIIIMLIMKEFRRQ